VTYSGYLSNNVSAKSVDVVITSKTLNRPRIGSVSLAGTNLVLAGNGGSPAGPYYVLASTNLALPLTNWTHLLTNSFDSGGSFNLTSTIAPAVPRRFYLLQLP
jgi:hypothetical protein